MSSAGPTEPSSASDVARWERVQALFHAAADLAVNEQRAFLESRCGGDARLLAEVEALLAEDRTPDSLLDRPLEQVAHRVLDQGAVEGQLGPYRIVRLLGEGGMGVVYLVERADVGGRAALKVLRDGWLSPERRERFRSEQRTLAQLVHPAIAQLHDVGVLADGTPWFAMEYVEGVPVTEYCRQHPGTLAERLRLIRAVCEAVQHAHRHAVIHRDLKPSNVLVTPEGTVKLVDFGIAKQLEAVDPAGEATRTGFRPMTPAYAAPEQFEGGRIGVHTDVYALGVVLYELLTGTLPFDLGERMPHEAVRRILEGEPVRPSLVPRAAWAPTASRAEWADLDVLCLTAMHRDPQRRYRTVEALIRDLDHQLRGEPLEARPDSVRYRAGKFVRRHARGVTVAALVGAAVVGLSAFYAVHLARARDAVVAEAARTQRIQRFMLQLFEGGTGEVGPAGDLRVVDLLERGVREARALDAEPVVQAELYQTLGGIAQNLGKLDQAEGLLRDSLEKRRAVFGPDHAEVANSLVALGLLDNARARFDDAERQVREGLAMARRHLPPDDPAVARATTALGQVLENRGDYPQAIEVLNEAVRLHSARGDATAELSVSLSELANSHFYRAEYEKADALNRRVIGIDRHLYGDRHPHVADDLINLGAVEFEWGRYAEAERLDREALEIMTAWYGPEHPEVASAQTLLARALVKEEKRDEAAVLLRQALATQEHVYGPVHPRVASSLNELGLIAQAQGRYDEAEADFRRMADIYTEVHHGKHYLIGIALSNLGGVYQARGEPGRAAEIFQQVLGVYQPVLAADHPLVGIAHVRRGHALISLRKFEEGERESQAGYQLLSAQPKPPAVWMNMARQDLAAADAALGRPTEAARYQAELPAPDAGPVTPVR